MSTTFREGYERTSDQLHKVMCLTVAADTLLEIVLTSSAAQNAPALSWQGKQRDALANLIAQIGDGLDRTDQLLEKLDKVVERGPSETANSGSAA